MGIGAELVPTDLGETVLATELATDTTELGNEVRNLIKLYDRETELHFGGPPYSAQVQRIILQTERFKQEGYPQRPRVATGSCIFDRGGNVIGYQETTIMNDAEPIAYEREHIRLRERLDYVQLKKIIVHPDHRGNGVSSKLLFRSFDIADETHKEWYTDVNAGNRCMIAFLDKNQTYLSRSWMTPKGTTMYRFKRK